MKLSGLLSEKGLHAFDHEPRTAGGIKLPRIWYLIVDREKAYIFRKSAKGIERIAEAKAAHDAGGAHHHGYDTHSQKHQHADSGFIRNLTKWLEHAATDDAYDRILIVAAPRALGDLRAVLGKTTQARVFAEVPEDLTKLSDKEIQSHLEKLA